LGAVDVLVVGVAVLAANGEDGDFVLLAQPRRNVVLSAQRVGGAEHDVRTARLKGARKVGRLGRDVQAARQTNALERLLAGEPLAYLAEDGHVIVRPLNPADAFLGERNVLDVMFCRHRRALC